MKETQIPAISPRILFSFVTQIRACDNADFRTSVKVREEREKLSARFFVTLLPLQQEVPNFVRSNSQGPSPQVLARFRSTFSANFI